MQSTRSVPPAPEWPCKRRCIEKEKKTVTFSSDVTAAFTNSNYTQVHSSWLTAYELVSMKKLAKTLSLLHYHYNHSVIVYDCSPAHYEVIGESLRGMEHYTDISKARRREQLRSDAIKLVVKHQYLYKDKENNIKLACMYKESTKEAMVYSRQIAEEDANVAAAIFAEA
mmetsp:Transcript_23205/g.38231  ORF Transcript_23205/g.38231 Transcript_23205/m.38231 type:complete len:169 (-) Transcript_23205:4-510(-)